MPSRRLRRIFARVPRRGFAQTTISPPAFTNRRPGAHGSPISRSSFLYQRALARPHVVYFASRGVAERSTRRPMDAEQCEVEPDILQPIDATHKPIDGRRHTAA